MGKGEGDSEEEGAFDRFLATYDKEYSQFNERIDKLRKSTSREKVKKFNIGKH